MAVMGAPGSQATLIFGLGLDARDGGNGGNADGGTGGIGVGGNGGLGDGGTGGLGGDAGTSNGGIGGARRHRRHWRLRRTSWKWEQCLTGRRWRVRQWG